MLILTRRPQETLRIDGRIRITVLGFKGNQVRLGIEAPSDVAVDREEIWVRKRQQGRSERCSLQPEGPAPAPLPDARPAGGSMPTLHDEARIP